MSADKRQKFTANESQNTFIEQYKSRGLFAEPNVSQTQILSQIDANALGKGNPNLPQPQNAWFDVWVNIGSSEQDTASVSEISCKC